jgi:hypothetical protein
MTPDPGTLNALAFGTIVVSLPVLLFIARGRWSRRQRQAAVMIVAGIVLVIYGPLSTVAVTTAARRTVVVEVVEPSIVRKGGPSTYAVFRGEGVDGILLRIPWQADGRLQKGQLVRITYTPATRDVWDLQVLRRVVLPSATIDIQGERFSSTPVLGSPAAPGVLFSLLGLALLIAGFVYLGRAR